MKLEEYRKRLIELESLPWNESYRKIAEADKLSIYLGKPSPMLRQPSSLSRTLDSAGNCRTWMFL
jgi:hypothetical protein